MNKRSFTVRGSAVTDLADHFYEELRQDPKGNVERYDGNGVDVIVVEEFYLRNSSDQQATVVFDVLEAETLQVTILTGGGGAGLLHINWGSHEAQTEKLVDRITDLCASSELQLDVAD